MVMHMAGDYERFRRAFVDIFKLDAGGGFLMALLLAAVTVVLAAAAVVELMGMVMAVGCGDKIVGHLLLILAVSLPL